MTLLFGVKNRTLTEKEILYLKVRIFYSICLLLSFHVEFIDRIEHHLFFFPTTYSRHYSSKYRTGKKENDSSFSCMQRQRMYLVVVVKREDRKRYDREKRSVFSWDILYQFFFLLFQGLSVVVC